MEQVLDFNKPIVIKIGENEYTCKALNMGHVIDIETAKVQYSNGSYGGLLRSGTIGAKIAVEITEMAAVFTVLFPKIKDDLKIKSLFELDLKNTLDLVKLYKKEVLPIYAEVVGLFSIEEDEEQKK